MERCENYDAVDATQEFWITVWKRSWNLTHYSLARFRARLDSVEGGMRYRFGYESQLGDGVSMQIVCTILDREGKPLFRVHANAAKRFSLRRARHMPSWICVCSALPAEQAA